MSLCEVNVNTVASDSTGDVKKSGAPPVLATYVSPPRNPGAAVIAQQQRRLESAGMGSGCATKKSMSTQEYPTMPGLCGGGGAPCIAPQHQQQHMMLMAALAAAAAAAQDGPDSCAKCPCPTCAYYRAYYHHFMSTNAETRCPSTLPLPLPALPLPNTIPNATPLVAGARRGDEGGVFRNIGAVPVMSMRTSTLETGPVSNATPTPTDSAIAPASMVTESPPLEEFYQRFVGHIADMACTSSGKTFLQALLRSQDMNVLDCIIKEFCEAGLNRIAIDNNGCHLLRAVVEQCSAGQVTALIGCLNETLILNMCTVSQYTRRTIQSLFQTHLQNGVDLQSVLTVLSRNASYLAATQQGCISLMRVYEVCDDARKALIMELLLPSLAYIALDPYGNYVVQCAIEHSNKMVAAQYVVNYFEGHLLCMSCDKYASNVVEKVIRFCGDVPAVRRMLLDELVYNPASLQEMVFDGFGNFVVQSLIESSQQPMELKRIHDRLKPALINSPFATKIEAKLKAQQRYAGARPATMMDKSVNSNERNMDWTPNSAGSFSMQQHSRTAQNLPLCPHPESPSRATPVNNTCSRQGQKAARKQARSAQCKTLPQAKGSGN
ncbi:unnamed protein product [Phytomonas sp. EM1]|nr:unnamed protein product [Phytomonas sp. EM1]|eukprot:CCW64479.1 unnamed protein product [Phytomonas sp. isolate EM1]